MRSKERKRAVSGSDGEDGVLPVQHRKRAIDIMERRIAGLMGEISLLHNSLVKLRKRHQQLEAQNGMLQEQQVASGSLHGSVNDISIKQVLASSATATSHGGGSDLGSSIHFMYPNVGGQMSPVGADGIQPMPSSAANATNTNTQTAGIIHSSIPTSQMPSRQDNSNQPMDDSPTLSCDFWDNLMFESDQLEPNSAHTARFASLAPSPRCQSQGVNYVSPSLSAAITLQSPTSEVASPNIHATATPGSSLPHTSSFLHSPLAPLAYTSNIAHQPQPYSPSTQLPTCRLSPPPQPPPTFPSPSMAFATTQPPHANHLNYPNPPTADSPGYLSPYLSYQPLITSQQQQPQPLEHLSSQWAQQIARNATANCPAVQPTPPPPSLGMMPSSDAIPIIVPPIRPNLSAVHERSSTENSAGKLPAAATPPAAVAHATWLNPTQEGSSGGWGAVNVDHQPHQQQQQPHNQQQQQTEGFRHTHQHQQMGHHHHHQQQQHHHHYQKVPEGGATIPSPFIWQPSPGDTPQGGGEVSTAQDNGYDPMCTTVQPSLPVPVPLPPPTASAVPAFLSEPGFWYQRRLRSNSGGGSAGGNLLEEGTGDRYDMGPVSGVYGASPPQYPDTRGGGRPLPAAVQSEGAGCSGGGGGDVMVGVVHGGGALPSPSVARSASGSAGGPGVGFTMGQTAAAAGGVPQDSFAGTPMGMVGGIGGVAGIRTATGESGYSPATNATAVLAQLQLSPTLSAGLSAGVTAPPGTEQLRSPSSGGAITAATGMAPGGSYEPSGAGPHHAAVHRSPAVEQRGTDSPGGRTVTSRPRGGAFGGGGLMSPLGVPAAPYCTSRLAPYAQPYSRSNPYGLHPYPVQHVGGPPPAGQPLCWRRVRVRDRMPLSQHPANAVHSHLPLPPPLSGMVSGPPPPSMQPVLHKYYGVPAPRLPYPAVTSYGTAAGVYTPSSIPPLVHDPYRTQPPGAMDAAAGMSYGLPGSSSATAGGGSSLPRAGSSSDYPVGWSTECGMCNVEDGMGG